MGGKGPQPLATVIQLIKGDPGHRAKAKLKGKEPRPPSSTNIKPPSFLDAEAKKEYNRITNMLGDMEAMGQKLLTDADITALASHCQNYSDYISACKDVKKRGQIIFAYDDNGKVKSSYKNESVDIKLKTMALHLKSCSLFGFDPSSRSKISVIKTDTVKKRKLDKYTQTG